VAHVRYNMPPPHCFAAVMNFNMASAGAMTAPYGAADHIMPEELRMREAQSTGGQQGGMAYANAGTAHVANGHSGQLWSAMNSTQSGLLPQQPHFADGGGSMLGGASAAYVGPRINSAPLPEPPNPHLYGVVQDEAAAAAAAVRPAAAAAGLAASGGGNGSSLHPHARQLHHFQNGGLFSPPPVQPQAQAYAFPRDWLAPGSSALPAAGIPHSQRLHQWQPALEHLDAQMSRPQRPRRHMASQYAAASPDLESLAAAFAHPLAAAPSPQLPTPPLQPPLQIKEAARRGRDLGQGSGGGGGRGGRGGRGRGAGRRGANRDEDEGDWKPPPTQQKAASQAAGAPSLRERSSLAPPRRLSQLRQHENGDGQQAGFVLPAAIGGSGMQLGSQTADYAGGSAVQLGALAAGYTAPAGTAAAAAAALRPPPQAQQAPSPKRQRPASTPAAPTGGSAWQAAPPPAEAAAPPTEPASTRPGCATPEPPAVPANSEPAPAAEPAAPAAPAPVAAAITKPPAAAVAAPAPAAAAPAADAAALATAGASKPAVESAAAPQAIAAIAAAPSDAAPTAKAPAAKTPAANAPEADSKDGDGVDSKAVVAAAAQAKVIWGRVKGFPFWPVGTFFHFCNVC